LNFVSYCFVGSMTMAMNAFPNYRRNIIQVLVIIWVLISGNFSLLAGNGISNFKVFFASGDFKSRNILVIRKFEKSGQQFYVAVDPDNLETQIIPSNQISLQELSWQQILLKFNNTAYIRAIQTAKEQSLSLQNSGIIHGFPKEKGVTLTVDLCPSHKPLDKIIFTSLISEFRKTEIPVPLALSITGRFILTHSEDLLWLKELIDSGEISVTWINHTYNHNYNPNVPLTENFLLEPNTDLNFEILGTEIALLQYGFLSSVFFRFPGLVSDQQVVVISYGLIPIGSDAWLAKGQPVHKGSIVLIHGNGNEPVGVKDFIRLLQTEKSSVMKNEWLLYDLRESIEDEFQE
jgi:hypothetical protein